MKYWKSSLNFHFEFPLDLAGWIRQWGLQPSPGGCRWRTSLRSLSLCFCYKYCWKLIKLNIVGPAGLPGQDCWIKLISMWSFSPDLLVKKLLYTTDYWGYFLFRKVNCFWWSKVNTFFSLIFSSKESYPVSQTVCVATKRVFNDKPCLPVWEIAGSLSSSQCRFGQNFISLLAGRAMAAEIPSLENN